MVSGCHKSTHATKTYNVTFSIDFLQCVIYYNAVKNDDAIFRRGYQAVIGERGSGYCRPLKETSNLSMCVIRKLWRDKHSAGRTICLFPTPILSSVLLVVMELLAVFFSRISISLIDLWDTRVLFSANSNLH